MRVILEASLLSSEQVSRHPLALSALFNLFLKWQCHLIEIEPPEAPEFQVWLNSLRTVERDEIELLIDESTQRLLREPPMKVIRVADVPEVEWMEGIPRIPLQAAIFLLQKPLRVFIEGVNDDAFLRSVVPRFYRARFEAWLEQELLKLEYRGGLPNLKHALQQESQTSERRLRLFVMIDSDARKRGEPSRDSKEVARLCERGKMAHHQLKRRSIENYLPEPALEQWLKRNHSRDFNTTWLPRLKAFRELSEEQRHHYNMKSGLRKDREGMIGLADIFETLIAQKPEQASLLEEGFGEAARCFKEDNIPEAWRVADGQSTELMELFEKMLRAA